MLPVAVHVLVIGSYSSAVFKGVVPLLVPPATKTLLLGNKTAICSERPVVNEPACVTMGSVEMLTMVVVESGGNV